MREEKVAEIEISTSGEKKTVLNIHVCMPNKVFM